LKDDKGLVFKRSVSMTSEGKKGEEGRKPLKKGRIRETPIGGSELSVKGGMEKRKKAGQGGEGTEKFII